MHAFSRRGAARALLLTLVAMAALVLPTAPAQAAWGTQLPLTLQIRHYYSTGTSVQVGYVNGTVQFDDAGNTLQYSLTFCRQSSYILPYLTINVNSSWIGGRKYATFVTNLYPSYTGTSSGQPCYSSTGTIAGQFTYANFWNVEFIAYGSTFDGPSHVIDSQDRIYTNPY
ncbi:hypothetical protein F4553_001224 [Allocatelliglobosispora scoriae]|uniref:Uncharacterized protein n=1 Tax=Allocatelliglobosispora scoriae TaxID=643052 RepID=A0A841BJN3_9ACTN|nr:hypothetical protein [Allocatelliglobosispora scoriae]MBB5867845.1 hypothetical protein [Allocatelliglobosispora scoriae]